MNEVQGASFEESALSDRSAHGRADPRGAQWSAALAGRREYPPLATRKRRDTASRSRPTGDLLIEDLPTAPRRIAVIRALQLGDLLVAVPALRALRAGFPQAEITLIGLPWAASFAERFRHYIDRFAPLPGYPGLQEMPFERQRTERFLREQRAREYDLAIQLHGSGQISNLLACDLGGQFTVGYFEDSPPPGLDLGAPYPHEQPEILRNLNLIRLLGCPDTGTDLEFPLWQEDRIEAARLLADFHHAPRPWIGLHPGSRSPARRWPPERFAAVANGLIARYGGTLIATGGPDEVETVESMVADLNYPVLNLAEKTTLGELAAVIDLLDLFISNDTGPAHIASAVETDGVVVFGPADPVRWAPLDAVHHPIVRHAVACSPCPHWICPIDHRCLLGIEPERVIVQAMQLLEESTACRA